MKSRNLQKVRMLLFLLIGSSFLIGCGNSRVVFVDSQTQVTRVGPNVKGKIYVWDGEAWELSANKVKYPEGHFVGALEKE